MTDNFAYIIGRIRDAERCRHLHEEQDAARIRAQPYWNAFYLGCVAIGLILIAFRVARSG